MKNQNDKREIVLPSILELIPAIVAYRVPIVFGVGILIILGS